MLRFLLMIIGLLALAGSAAAQSEAVPTPVTVAPDDPRLTVCAAPTLPDFEPHTVRPDERLVDLLAGNNTFTVTQIAALNCLDDPASLPVGAVIWLPHTLPDLITTQPYDADPTTDAAEIISLTASSPNVNNADGVSFTWEATGTAAYFYTCPPDAQASCLRPAEARPVPLAYTTPIFNGFRTAGTLRYRLEVVDGEASAVQDVFVGVSCTQATPGLYSAYQPCPDNAPNYVFAAWQPFEHGVMIWWSDTQQIWVMTNDDHQVRIYEDTYQDGEPDPDFAAPDNLFTPTRGFGKLWAALGGPDSALGWALIAELGYQISRQPAGRVSYTTYISVPGELAYIVTFVPGQDAGYWTHADQ
ncbi:MAG: hypothetical protein K8I60_02550 [Anaerolineae bacterium]|nr:hypothetical protein [Anaerolineae bacterium]